MEGVASTLMNNHDNNQMNDGLNNKEHPSDQAIHLHLSAALARLEQEQASSGESLRRLGFMTQELEAAQRELEDTQRSLDETTTALHMRDEEVTQLLKERENMRKELEAVRELKSHYHDVLQERDEARRAAREASAEAEQLRAELQKATAEGMKWQAEAIKLQQLTKIPSPTNVSQTSTATTKLEGAKNLAVAALGQARELEKDLLNQAQSRDERENVLVKMREQLLQLEEKITELVEERGKAEGIKQKESGEITRTVYEESVVAMERGEEEGLRALYDEVGRSLDMLAHAERQDRSGTGNVGVGSNQDDQEERKASDETWKRKEAKGKEELENYVGRVNGLEQSLAVLEGAMNLATERAEKAEMNAVEQSKVYNEEIAKIVDALRLKEERLAELEAEVREKERVINEKDDALMKRTELAEDQQRALEEMHECLQETNRTHLERQRESDEALAALKAQVEALVSGSRGDEGDHQSSLSYQVTSINSGDEMTDKTDMLRRGQHVITTLVESPHGPTATSVRDTNSLVEVVAHERHLSEVLDGPSNGVTERALVDLTNQVRELGEQVLKYERVSGDDNTSNNGADKDTVMDQRLNALTKELDELRELAKVEAEREAQIISSLEKELNRKDEELDTLRKQVECQLTELEEFRKKISTNEEEDKKRKQDADTKTKDWIAHEIALQEAVRRETSLKETLVTEQLRMKTLETSLETLKQEHAKEINLLEAKVHTAEGQVKAVTEIAEKRLAEIELLRTQADGAVGNAALLTQLVSTLTSDRREAEAEARRLERDMESVRAELQLEKHKGCAFEEQVEHQRRLAVQFKNQLEQSRAELSTLRITLDNEKEKTRALTTREEQLRSQLERAQANEEALRVQSKVYEEKGSTNDEVMKAIQNERDAANTKVEETEALIMKEKTLVSELKSKLEAMEADIAAGQASKNLEIDRLQRELESVQAELQLEKHKSSAFEEQVTQQRKLAIQLKNQLEHAHTDNKLLRSKLEAALAEIDTINETLCRVKQEAHTSLTEELMNKEKIKGLEVQVEMLQGEIKKTEIQSRTVLEDLQNVSKERDQLKATLKEKTEEMEKAGAIRQEEIATLKTKMEEMQRSTEKMMKDAEEKVLNVMADMEKTKKELVGAEGEKESLTGLLREKEEEIKAKEDGINVSRTALRACEETLATKDKDLQSTKERVLELQSLVDAKERELSTLQQEMVDKDAYVATLRGQVQEANKARELSDSEALTQLRHEFEEVKMNLTKAVAENTELTENHSRAMASVEAADRRVKEVEEKEGETELKLNEAEQQRREIEAKMLKDAEASRGIEGELQTLISDLRERLVKVEAEKDVVMKEKEELDALLKTTSTAHNTALKGMEASVVKAKEDANKEVAAMQGRLEGLTEELASARLREDELTESLQTTMNTVKAVKEEKDIVETQYADALRQVDGLKDECESLKREIASLQETLALTDATTADQLAAANLVKARLTAVESELTQQIATREKRIEEIAVLNSERDTLKALVESQEKKLKLMHRQLSDATKQLERMKGIAQSEASAELVKAHDEITTLKTTLDETILALKEATDKITEKDHEFDTLKEHLDTSTATIQGLQNELKEKVQLEETLVSTLDVVRSEGAQVRESLTEALEQLDASRMEALELMNANDDLNLQLSTLMTEKKNVERERDDLKQNLEAKDEELKSLVVVNSEAQSVQEMVNDLSNKLAEALEEVTTWKKAAAEHEEEKKKALATVEATESKLLESEKEAKEQIQKTADETAGLAEELAAERRRVAQLDEELEKALGTAHNLKEEIVTLRNDAEKRSTEQSGKEQDYEAELWRLREIGERLAEEAEAAQKEKEELAAKLQETEGKWDQAKALYEASLQAETEAETQVKDLTERLEAAKERETTLEQDMNKLKGKMAETGTIVTSLQEEKENLQREVTKCLTALDEVQKNAASHQLEKEALLKENVVLQGEKEAIQSQADDAVLRAADLEEEVSKGREEIDSQKLKISTLEDDLSRAISEQESLIKSLQVASQDRDKYAEQATIVERELHDVRRELNEVVGTLERERAGSVALHQQLSQMQDQLTRLTELNNELEGEREHLQDQLMFARDQLQQTQTPGPEGMSAEDMERLRAAEEQAENLRETVEMSEQALGKLQQDLEAARKATSDAKNQIEDLTSQLETKEKLITSLNGDIEKLTGHAHELEAKVEEQERQIKEMEEREAQVKAAREEGKNDKEDDSAPESTNHDGSAKEDAKASEEAEVEEVLALKEQIALLERDLNSASNALENERGRHTQEKMQFKGMLMELRAAVTDAREAHEKAVIQLRDVEVERDRLREALTEAGSRGTQDDTDRLSARNEQLEALVKQLEEDTARLHKRAAVAEKARAESEKDAVRSVDELNGMTIELSALRSEKSTLEQDVESMREQITALRNEVDHLNNLLEAQELQLTKYKQNETNPSQATKTNAGVVQQGKQEDMSMSSETEDKTAELMLLRDEVGNLYDELRREKEAVLTIQERLEEKTTRVTELEQLVIDAEERVDEALATAAKARETTESAMESEREARRAEAEWKALLEELKQEYTEYKASAEEKLSDVTKTFVKMANVDEVEEEKGETHDVSTIELLEAEIERMAKQMKEESEARVADVATAKETLTAVLMRLEGLQHERDTLKTERDDAQSEIQDLRALSVSLQDRIDTMSERAQEQEQINEALLRRLSAYQEELNTKDEQTREDSEIKDALIAAHAELETLKSAYDDLEQERATTQDQLVAAKSQLETLEQELINNHERFTSLQREYNTACRVRDTLQAALRAAALQAQKSKAALTSGNDMVSTESKAEEEDQGRPSTSPTQGTVPTTPQREGLPSPSSTSQASPGKAAAIEGEAALAAVRDAMIRAEALAAQVREMHADQAQLKKQQESLRQFGASGTGSNHTDGSIAALTSPTSAGEAEGVGETENDMVSPSFKSVFLRFVDQDEQDALLPVISKMLQLSPEESASLRAKMERNKGFLSRWL